MLDYLITNATIVDGGGGAPYPGHVGLAAHRLAGIWRGEPPRATRIVEATGRFWPRGSSTSILMPTSCTHSQLSAAPRSPAAGSPRGSPRSSSETAVLEPVPRGETLAIFSRDSTPGCLPASRRLRRESVSAYLDALEDTGVDANVGTLVPHGPLRLSAMGLAAGSAGREARRSMTEWLAEGSTREPSGSRPGSSTRPGCTATRRSRPSWPAWPPPAAGLHEPHPRLERDAARRRWRADRDRTHRRSRGPSLAQRGRRARALVEDRGVLEREEQGRRGRRRGLVRHVPLHGRGHHDARHLSAVVPRRGRRRLLERLGDAAERRRIAHDVEGLAPQWPPWTPGAWPHNLVRAVGWEGIRIGSATLPESKRYEFMSLAELGALDGKSPFDAVSRPGARRAGARLAADLRHLGVAGRRGARRRSQSGSTRRAPPRDRRKRRKRLRQGSASPGGLRGVSPHARALRAAGRCRLEQAIRKMTGRPAEIFGITNGGSFARVTSPTSCC